MLKVRDLQARANLCHGVRRDASKTRVRRNPDPHFPRLSIIGEIMWCRKLEDAFLLVDFATCTPSCMANEGLHFGLNPNPTKGENCCHMCYEATVWKLPSALARLNRWGCVIVKHFSRTCARVRSGG